MWKGDKRSWDVFLWKNSGGHQSFVSFSKLFQLCTHARIMMGRSRERLRFVRRIFEKKSWLTLHSHEFSNIFQLCTHATVTRNGSKEK